MSCFPGPLRRFSDHFHGISVDHFAGENLASSAFFLSHLHSDHMTGLRNREFYQCLKNGPNSKLYMSEITMRLLFRERNSDGKPVFEHLKPFVVALPLLYPMEVTVYAEHGSKYTATVTLFNAQHCIGSVMFLFERVIGHDTKRILYTGDIRLTVQNFNKDEMPQLFLENGCIKSFDVLCIDTTFCCPQAKFIPSYSQSTRCLRQFVMHFVRERSGNRVLLNLPANIGHESLLESCVAALGGNTRIHVSPPMYARYLGVPDIANQLTESDQSVAVHACCDASARMALANSTPDRIWWCEKGLPLDCADDRLAIIRPSIMHFADDKVGPDQIFYRDPVAPMGARHRTYHLCYSAHSSFDELSGIVTFLRPKFIVPNVAPKDSSIKAARDLLERSIIVALSVPATLPPVGDFDDEETKETAIVLPKKRKVIKAEIDDESADCGLDFGLDFSSDDVISVARVSAAKRPMASASSTSQGDVIILSSDEDD